MAIATGPRCATYQCPEPATWQRIWQSPRMSAPAFYNICIGCAARAREWEQTHPDCIPARYLRLEA